MSSRILTKVMRGYDSWFHAFIRFLKVFISKHVGLLDTILPLISCPIPRVIQWGIDDVHHFHCSTTLNTVCLFLVSTALGAVYYVFAHIHHGNTASQFKKKKVIFVHIPFPMLHLFLHLITLLITNDSVFCCLHTWMLLSHVRFVVDEVCFFPIYDFFVTLPFPVFYFSFFDFPGFCHRKLWQFIITESI